MPGGDKTGPLGMGPMTGRAMGYCSGNKTRGGFSQRGARGQQRSRSNAMDMPDGAGIDYSYSELKEKNEDLEKMIRSLNDRIEKLENNSGELG